MLSYVTCKIHSDTLSFGGVTIFNVKSVNIIPGLPYIYMFSYIGQSELPLHIVD